jgi:hypothetical protein
LNAPFSTKIGKDFLHILVIKLLAENYDIILPSRRRRRRGEGGIENPNSNIFGYLQSIQLLYKKIYLLPN